jgi:hypothetical protein
LSFAHQLLPSIDYIIILLLLPIIVTITPSAHEIKIACLSCPPCGPNQPDFPSSLLQSQHIVGWDNTMNYLHHSYPYSGHAGIPIEQPVGCGPPLAHPAMAGSMDGYILARNPYDMMDYAHMPIMDDYEEYTENLSRPRLTKDQVDTLEAQFQAHPKPNSNTKRQLAVQTNLSLPRVAVRSPDSPNC